MRRHLRPPRGVRHSSALCLRARRRLAGLLLLLHLLLHLVVVLHLVDLVLLRLLLRRARPEARRGRGAACVAGGRDAVGLSEFFGVSSTLALQALTSKFFGVSSALTSS